MKENNAKLNWNFVMLVPIFGWVFIAYGLIWPFENTVLLALWWIDIFLSVVVHTVQIFVAFPLGKKTGYTPVQSVLYTLAFGATFWKPLRELNSSEL